MNEELIYGLFNLLIKMNFLHREKKTLIQREREREKGRENLVEAKDGEIMNGKYSKIGSIKSNNDNYFQRYVSYFDIPPIPKIHHIYIS